MHFTSNSNFDGLRGHVGLRTASINSEIKFVIRFVNSNLYYLKIHAHVSPKSHIDGLRGHGNLQIISEVTHNPKFELNGLNNFNSSGFVASMYRVSWKGQL